MFPREVGSWPCVGTFEVHGYVFEPRRIALVVLTPKTGGIPTAGAIETTTVINAPLMPTDQKTALSQQEMIIEKLGFDPKSAAIIVPFDPEKIQLPVPDYFKTWAEVEKQSWRVQIEANFRRQQQALLGFPRLEDSPPVPPGYEHLVRPLSAFLQDHPNYRRNVFIMTRFAPQLNLDETVKSVRDIMGGKGYSAIKANDKSYTGTGDRNLWNNVCVYMIGCSKGIAILENAAGDEFNPNIAIEYGFMRALNKPVLVLVDRNFQKISADIGGIIYERFDLANKDSLPPILHKWVTEIEAS